MFIGTIILHNVHYYFYFSIINDIVNSTGSRSLLSVLTVGHLPNAGCALLPDGDYTFTKGSVISVDFFLCKIGEECNLAD